jgi:hypothetical protein
MSFSFQANSAVVMGFCHGQNPIRPRFLSIAIVNGMQVRLKTERSLNQ